jgi:hypothetical protein
MTHYFIIQRPVPGTAIKVIVANSVVIIGYDDTKGRLINLSVPDTAIVIILVLRPL